MRLAAVLLAALATLLAATALNPAPSAAHPEECAAPAPPAERSIPNPEDTDCDGVKNEADNCPDVKNGSQTNTDATFPGGDSLGDACDDDDDADGVPDTSDNCRLVQNPDQQDSDGDGFGDACPPVDSDGDGVTDDRDNCPAVPNPDQADLDGDQQGDPCDDDDDSDLIPDARDNCPRDANQDQLDRDGDGQGSVCDPGEGFDAPPGTAPGATPTPTPTAPDDGRAPGIRVTSARVRRLADVRGGMATRVRCSEACALTAVLVIEAADARRLRLGRQAAIVARGEAEVGGPASTYLFLKLRRGVAAKLARAGRRGARAVLEIEAFDPAGNARATARALVLRP